MEEFASLDERLAAAMADARQQADPSMATGAAASARQKQAAHAAMDEILRPLLQEAAANTASGEEQPLPNGSVQNWRATHRALCKTAITTFRSEKRCQNCGAFSPRIRSNDHSKIFQSRLSKNHARLNAAEGIVLQSALTSAASDDRPQQRTAADDKGDDEEEDYDDEEDSAPIQDEDKFVPTIEVRAQLQRLYEREPFLCRSILGNLDKYFMQVVPVPPSRFRPPMMLETMSVEHAQTAHLSQILVKNAIVRDRIAAASANNDNSNQTTKKSSDLTTGGGDVYAAWIDLQTAVNIFMDGSKDPNAGAASATVVNGIRQLLERKEGLFRKNMMGKRVDFACRSVISPDPYIGTNEIGLPAYFASILTYPTPVTPRNVAEMRALVERGPNGVGDGARWVEKDHRRIDLSKMNAHQRRAVAAQLLLRGGGSGQYDNKYDNNHIGTIVGRQLRDGDYVLMNRQVCF
jgi:DNA-directed RNA polymerase I subunit RPA1